MGYTKDGACYFADGNFTILVEGTLFRIHKSIFARDGSTFEGMFESNDLATAMASGGGESTPSESVVLEKEKEGMTDENPIHLHGDTAEEFRDLLWSLYALPQEISTAGSEGDLTKLSNVVRMAHKYHYITTEAWALGVLLGRFLSQTASSISSIPMLVRITEVAVLCEDKPLLYAVRMRWKGLIGKRKDLAVAINVMGRLGIRDLEGLAYYGMLFEGKGRWDSDPGLTPDQRIRLLSGHYNITKASEALTVTPPKFDHNPACDAEADCEEAWQNFWKAITALDSGDGSSVVSRIVVHDKMDLMGRLMMAVSFVTAFEAESSMGIYRVYNPALDVDHQFRWSECIGAALSATIRMSKDTQQNLMGFFEDVV